MEDCLSKVSLRTVKSQKQLNDAAIETAIKDSVGNQHEKERKDLKEVVGHVQSRNITVCWSRLSCVGLRLIHSLIACR